MSTVNNKNSGYVTIPYWLRKKKNPYPNLQKQDLLFSDQDAFLNDNVQEEKKKGYPWSSAIQTDPQKGLRYSSGNPEIHTLSLPACGVRHQLCSHM